MLGTILGFIVVIGLVTLCSICIGNKVRQWQEEDEKRGGKK